MCPTSSSKKAVEQSEAGQERGRKKKETKLASSQPYTLCTNVLWRGGRNDGGKKRWLKIYDTRNRNKSKMSKHFGFVAYIAGKYINATV